MRIQGIQWDTVRSRGKQPEGIIHEDTGDTRGYSTLQVDTATGDNSRGYRGYNGIKYVTGGYSHRG